MFPSEPIAMEWYSPALTWVKVTPVGGVTRPGLLAGVPVVSRPSCP